MVALQLACLGHFQVTLGGAALTAFQTDKTRALLAYLTLADEVHQRTTLAQFLWPGYSEESARNSLRQSLHQLRQLLRDAEAAPPWLLLTRQTVQINPAAPISVDVKTFNRLLAECTAHPHEGLTACPACLARLRQAVDLYHGDFLAGFTVADSDPFEEWRRIFQEQLHLQMLDALAHLAAAAETAGDDEQALLDARRQLALEPWLEEAHCRIMRLLARRGQSAAALAQYKRCRQVLAEELGTEPDRETTALYEQIRSGQWPAARSTERAAGLHPSSAQTGPFQTPPWPAQLPPLLGRTAELAEITTLLGQPTFRLVTLVGPPGVGKTRLAQAVLDFSGNLPGALADSPTAAYAPDSPNAPSQQPQFAHGLHFIDLAALRDPTLLAATIAQSLTVPENGLPLTGERLIERLRDQEILLVLDNFEHVLPGVALLGQLLAYCPHLKLLITSRVPLRMPGEQVVVVHPLPLPEPTEPVTLALVAQNVAVQLFCQRAAAVVPGFALTERLAPVVVEICRRLDGLPLAIELAAARSRLLPPPALLERLTAVLPARLALLTSGSQALPARQQTLRAAIAWSYALLTPDEQRLFRQLTVFAGGATLAAIEAVIGPGTNGAQPLSDPQAEHSIVDALESLLDKSLLRQQELPNARPDTEPRVIMLETIREYGWERLAAVEATASDNGQSTQQRHAEFFLAFAEATAPKLHGAAQVEWLDRLALEHDNLRVALDWFVQTGAWFKALRLATALRYFWRVRGHYREGSERLRQILARPETAPTGGPVDAVRARALNAAGYLQWVQGKTTTAQGLLQEALTLGRAMDDAEATAFALRYLGLVADVQQQKATAQRLLEESLARYRTLDHANETALALMYLGDAAFGQQRYDQAQQLYQESADLLRRLGNYIVLPYALRHLGYLALARGHYKEALGLCTESLRLNWAAGEQQGSAAALAALAAVAVAGERWVPATRLLACVATWLAANQAQLLPFDRATYAETQRLLEQHYEATNETPSVPIEPLAMDQALAYVVQALAFDEQPAQQPILATSRQGDPKTSHEPADTLPVFPTPLIGRAQALAEIGAQLQQPAVRLLTLIGPGGMGKTRLAVEVGRERLDTFADGVYFIPLAPLRTADALVGAIATALGLALQGGDPHSTLLQMLRQKQLLLILDNFEHLLVEDTKAVDLVVELLDMAPGVQIIVTSRERLKLRGEQLYPVQALAFSPTATLAEAAASAAVRLFVQAVQRVQADFQLTAANLAAVLRICRLVQGMPLGLELAAANVGGVPLMAIADAIEQSAEFLAVAWRDVPERQRSMRAVFAWSWQLLSAAEQRILRQSVIFRGGFTYAAAQAVTGATAALLTRLTDKSLLQWSATVTGEGRYALHELLRQFAAEELNAAAEHSLVEERHGRYYLAYLAERGLRLGRGEPAEASNEIQAELDNVRQAWQWAATQGQLAAVEQAVYAWWQFCQFQGLELEGRQSIATALAGARQQLALVTADAAVVLSGQPLLAKLLALHANYLFAQGRDEEMTAQAREAIALGAASGGFEGEILGTFVLGRVLQDHGQKREASDLWRQTIQLIRRYQPSHPAHELLHEVHWMAYNWLRGSALHFGDYAGSRAYVVQALQICQILGKRRGELFCLAALAGIDFFLYDFAAAEAGFVAVFDLARTLHYRRVEMMAQEGLSALRRLRGDYTMARTLLEQALTNAIELAFPYDEALFLAALIRLHCQLGDQTAAAQRQVQLTQLLARVELAKECQLYRYLAAALRAYYAGATQEALGYAEQADQVNKNGGDILFRLVDTALILGHTRAAVGQWEPAQAAFQEAFAAFQHFGNHALAAEPQAGLAQIALAQGDLAGAQAQVEAILPVLAEQPYAGYNDPFFIYLTCYRVLVANADPRAATLLQQGYALIQQVAVTLDDEQRQRFLTGAPFARDLVAAYTEMQARMAKETRDEETRDKETRDKETHDKETHDKETRDEERGTIAFPVSPARFSLSALRDWERMPTARQFHGRSQELANLIHWIKTGHCRVVTVLGIGGVGKTALVAQAVRTVADQFDVVIWSSLLNAPPLGELLLHWLRVLTQTAATKLPEGEEEQLRLLFQYLNRQRCLLVLDNAESILDNKPAQATDAVPPAGALRLGYENYAQLLQSLGQNHHRSCLLITSRELPYALQQWRDRAPVVRVLSLAGLEAQAGQALLQAHGLVADDQTTLALVDHYSGNPLALQIVSHTIVDLYAGDIRAFTAEGAPIFDDIRTMLDQQVARLSSMESELLLWLAIEREPVTLTTLRNDLVDKGSQRTFLEALRALQRRSLLEKAGERFTLQNVITEYLTDRFVEGICHELLTFAKERALSSFNRHALLKAGATEAIRQSQVRLILHPLAERLLAKLGEKRLIQQARCWLDWLRHGDAPRQGYAGGNLLNLLLYLAVDIAEFDFSGIAVWQAFLRGAYLPRLDFTNADLTGSVFTHRFGDIQSLHYSFDGDLAVAGLREGALRLWRAVTGELRYECSLAGLRPITAAWSPDGQRAAVATADCLVHLFDVAEGRRLATLTGAAGSIWRLCFNVDGQQIACGDTSGQVTVWATNGQRLYTLHGHATAITGLAYARSRARPELLASGAADGVVCLWNAQTGELIHQLQGHTGEVAALGFALDGQRLATGSNDFSVRLWDVESGLTLHTLQRHTQPIRNIAVTPAGNLLATGSGDKRIYLWDVERGEVRHVLSDQAIVVAHLCFSQDEQTLATFDLNGTLCLWNVQQGQRLNAFQVYRNAVRSVDFSPTQNLVAAGGGDGAIYLWEIAPSLPPSDNSTPATGRVRLPGALWARLPGHHHSVAAVAFSPDGETLASGDTGQTIFLHNFHKGTRQILHGHRSNIVALSFNTTGRLLASASGDGTVGVWATASGQKLHTLQGHTNAVTACCFSPDGSQIASCGIDRTICLWDAERGELRHTLRAHTNAVQSIVFSMDGQRLFSSSFDQSIRLWDVHTGQLLATWPTPNTVFVSLAVHAGGEMLAAGAQDQLIYLLELRSGRVLGTLAGHSYIVDAVKFSRDGQLLLSASRDETVKIWQVDAGSGRGVCRQTLAAPGPYPGMQIAGVTGISEAQKAALRALGAVEQ